MLDQKWEFVFEDGILTFSDTVIAVVGLDDDDDDDKDEDDEENDVDKNNDDKDNDDGFCLVTNAGSVVTCQWEVCGTDPAALE